MRTNLFLCLVALVSNLVAQEPPPVLYGTNIYVLGQTLEWSPDNGMYFWYDGSNTITAFPGNGDVGHEGQFQIESDPSDGTSAHWWWYVTSNGFETAGGELYDTHGDPVSYSSGVSWSSSGAAAYQAPPLDMYEWGGLLASFVEAAAAVGLVVAAVFLAVCLIKAVFLTFHK